MLDDEQIQMWTLHGPHAITDGDGIPLRQATRIDPPLEEGVTIRAFDADQWVQYIKREGRRWLLDNFTELYDDLMTVSIRSSMDMMIACGEGLMDAGIITEAQAVEMIARVGTHEFHEHILDIAEEQLDLIKKRCLNE